MSNIILEKKETLEYIKDILNDYKTKPYIVNDAKFHHNSSYSDAAKICKYGILTLKDLKKLEIKNISDETLKLAANTESHINGIDHISLAIMGLTDLYPEEEEYDSYYPTYVDFLITNKIQVYRNTSHYGNEFLHEHSIPNDKLKSVDIRILELINQVNNKEDTNTIQEIIDKYNHLKDIAIAIKENNLDIPLREASNNNNYTLDIDKLSSMKKIKLK